MGLGRLGQTLTAREIFDLVKKDLERVERLFASSIPEGITEHG